MGHLFIIHLYSNMFRDVEQCLQINSEKQSAASKQWETIFALVIRPECCQCLKTIPNHRNGHLAWPNTVVQSNEGQCVADLHIRLFSPVWRCWGGVVPEADRQVLQSPVMGFGSNQEQAEERPTLQLFHSGIAGTEWNSHNATLPSCPADIDASAWSNSRRQRANLSAAGYSWRTSFQ